MEPAQTDINEDILYCKYNMDIQSRSLYYNLRLSLYRLERNVRYSTLRRDSKIELRRAISKLRSSLYPRNGKKPTIDSAIDNLAAIEGNYYEKLEEEEDEQAVVVKVEDARGRQVQ